MPISVRDGSSKWSKNAGAAAGDYAAGAAAPKRSWQAASQASETNYEAGVQASISRKAYGKGVGKAGDAAWSSGIQNVGRNRYQQGVTVSQAKYQAGFSKYASVIAGVTLAPRGPKGTNYGRVQAVGDALHKAKIS